MAKPKGLADPHEALKEYVHLLRIVANNDPNRPPKNPASPIAHLLGEAALKAGLIAGEGRRDTNGAFLIKQPHLTPEGARALFEWTELLARGSVKIRVLSRLEQFVFLAVGALLAAVPQFFSDPPVTTCVPVTISPPMQPPTPPADAPIPAPSPDSG